MVSDMENPAGAGGASGKLVHVERDKPEAKPSPARLQHLVRRLYALGPRPTYELLREIAAGADLFDRLEAYARLDPHIVHALGGDRLPIDSWTVLDGGRT